MNLEAHKFSYMFHNGYVHAEEKDASIFSKAPTDKKEEQPPRIVSVLRNSLEYCCSQSSL